MVSCLGNVEDTCGRQVPMRDDVTVVVIDLF